MLCREQLKDSPEKVSSLLAKNEYLEATQILTQSLDHLYGDLKNVDGLSEVKEILDAKKEVTQGFCTSNYALPIKKFLQL